MKALKRLVLRWFGRELTKAERLERLAASGTVIDQVNHCLASAARTREELEFWAERLVELHQLDPKDTPAEFIREVVYCGVDYQRGLEKSMRYIQERAAGELD